MATRKEISEAISQILADEYFGPPSRIHEEVHRKLKSGKTDISGYLLNGKYSVAKIRALKQMIGEATVRSLAAEVLRQFVEESSSSGQIKKLLDRWNSITPQARREFFSFGRDLPECLSAIGFSNVANHLYASGALGPQPRKLSALQEIFKGCSSVLGE